MTLYSLWRMEIAQCDDEIIAEHSCLLFVAQGVDGIGSGDPQGVAEHGYPGDQQGRKPAAAK